MNQFKLRKHHVNEASFIGNIEKVRNNSAEIRVEGGLFIPKDFGNSRYLTVQLKFSAGNSGERFYLMLETLSIFEIEGEDSEMKEEDVQAVCVPIALAELRKTVKKVTEAYGIPVLDLPPFEGEIED